MRNNKIINSLFFFAASILFIYLLVNLLKYHYNLIVYPFQHEYREGAPLLLASEFLKGNLPYTFRNQPYLSDVFGFMYSLCSLPFIKFFGVNLSSMRILSGLCILITVGFMYHLQRIKGISKYQAVIFCLALYSVNLFSCIPIARPDSLGYLFFILTLYLPFKYQYSRNSLLLSIFFCVLSYFTKSYFIVGFFFVLTFVFLFQSKLKAFKYGVIFVLFFLSALLLIHLVFDFYFVGTFSTQLQSTVNDFNHLVGQLKFYFYDLFLIFGLGISFLFLRFLVVKRSKILYLIEQPTSVGRMVNFFDLEHPFLQNFKMNENLLYFTLGLLLIIFKLGGHTGQFGVYLIHFMTFPLLLFYSQLFHEKKHLIHLELTLLICTSLIYPIYKVLPIKANFNDFGNLMQVQQEIRLKNEILATPSLAALLIEDNKKVYASGLTEYFFYVPSFKENYGFPTYIAKLKDKLFLNLIHKSETKIDTYINNISTKVRNKKFEIIYIDNTIYDDWMIDTAILRLNYEMKDSFIVNMYSNYQKVTVYKFIPKK